MIKLKTFLKKTRRGKVLKIVREHYLRTDIACGSDICQECPKPMIVSDENTPPKYSTLSENPRQSFKLPSECPRRHYIVLDTNIILNQIDVLEVPIKDGGLGDVIILQTVLEEVRHRSSPIYKRLKDIIVDQSRHFYVFINEHHKDTYIERNQGETANDRNDRAIRFATQWYNKHLEGYKISTILITDDRDNALKASKEGLVSFTMKEYLKEHPAMFDKLNLLGEGGSSGGQLNKKFLYPEHWSPAQINGGIKTGKLHQGVFYLNRTNFQEGSVNVEGLDEPILVQGLEQLNRAVDGDVVAVELLEKVKWSAPAEVVLEDEGYDPGDTLEQDKDVLEQAIKARDVKPTGKVVGIIRRKWRQYCGMLQENPSGSQATRHIFVPAEKKIPKIRIETRQACLLKGQRIIGNVLLYFDLLAVLIIHETKPTSFFGRE